MHSSDNNHDNVYMFPPSKRALKVTSAAPAQTIAKTIENL